MLNYHAHTNCTVDADATVREYCEKAKELGFSEVCITNHHELERAMQGNYDFALTETQWDSLREEISQANREFSPLKVKLGVEIDFQLAYTGRVLEFLRKHPFDYVISSIHFLDGIVIADSGRKIPTHIDVRKFYGSYFSKLKDMIVHQDFDCIGHLDVIRRAAPALPFKDYEKEIEVIAQLMLKHDKGFEVNTSGWRYGNGAPYPCFEIIKKLYDCGVRKITIGSDCHHVIELDSGLKEGLELLKKAGFTQVCTFEKRKPSYVDI